MSRPRRYPPQLKAHALAQVADRRTGYPSEWATIQAIATEHGISAETLRGWLRQAESGPGRRSAGPGGHVEPMSEHEALRREVLELRRALDLLRSTEAIPGTDPQPAGRQGPRRERLREAAGPELPPIPDRQRPAHHARRAAVDPALSSG